MIVSNCPRCAEEFRVPTTDMPDGAYAKCPWCNETFPIVEVIHRLPPVLEVLSPDGESLPLRQSEVATIGAHLDAYATTGQPGNKTVSDKTVSDETVRETWNGDVATLVPDPDGIGDLELDPEMSEQPSDEIAPMRVRPAPIPARKSKGSPIRTMISIVLGALAAGPLAIAILWVLTLFGVNVDLGFWPLDGHSSVAVPTRVAATPLPRSQGVDITDLADHVEGDQGRDGSDQSDQSNGSDQRDGKDQSDRSDPSDGKQIGDPLESDSAGESSQTLATSAVESDQLLTAVGTAMDFLDSFSDAEAPSRDNLRDSYIAIARVGAIATTNSASVSELVQQIKAAPPNTLQDWGDAAPNWMNLPAEKRPNDGILVVGRRTDARTLTLPGSSTVALAEGSIEPPIDAEFVGIGRIQQTDSERSIQLVAAELLP